MKERMKEILDAAICLPEAERADLVEVLATTLDDDIYTEELHPDWGPELDRRVRELREGKVKGIPWEEVKARAHREVFGN